MKKRLKITGYSILTSLLVINFFFIIFAVKVSESERGPRELQEYYDCGQESQLVRAMCLGRVAQKSIVKELGNKIGL